MMFLKSTNIPYYIPLPAFEKNIHTYLMNFPIDIIFIDKINCVLDKTTLEPWKNYTPNNKKYAVAAIEDAAGKFKDIQIGDFVTFKKI